MYDGTIRGAIGSRLGLAARLGRACPLRSSTARFCAASDGGESRGWCGPAAALGRAGDRREAGAGPAERGGDPRDPAVAAGTAGATAARAVARARQAVPAAGAALPAGESAQPTAGGDRLQVPDQPGDGAAALRRPADRRGRGAGRRLGRRGPAHAGPRPLGPHAQHRLRLHPPRRRRPGLQQGHHDGAERQLLLRRRRADRVHRLDRRHLPAPGRAADPQRPPLGDPGRQERRPDDDGDGLLLGAPAAGDVHRRPVLHRAGSRPGRAHRAVEPRPGPRASRSIGRGTWSPTSSSRPSPRGRSGGSRAPTSRRSCGWTRARWSSRSSTTTFRSP